MRRWARWGTLALGMALIGCGPQPDAPTTPIVGATATVGGAGTGTPQAVGSATAGTPTAPLTTTVLATSTRNDEVPPGTNIPLPPPTGTAVSSRSPAAAGTITSSMPITGTSVAVPIPPTAAATTITATAVTTTAATAPVIVAGDPRQVVRDFLGSVQGDPGGLGGAVFFSRDLQSRLRGGTNLLSLMHLPSVYQSFSVTGPDPDFTAGTGGARAVLTYPDGPQIRDFRLRVEANAWVIAGIASPDEGDLTAADMLSTPAAGTALPAAPTPGGTETPPSLAPPTVEGEPTAPGPLPP